MTESYRDMWQGLGLDLESHDVLLTVLGKAYQDIYLAQKDRPEGMGYFDFVMSEVHGLRIKELLDECDLVKFAKYVPQNSEIDKDFEAAVDLVETTRPPKTEGGAVITGRA